MAEILIAPHGSPYEIDKDDRRIDFVGKLRVKETGLPMIFLNRIGGQDELVFDGCSFVLNADATLAHQLPDWGRSFCRDDMDRGAKTAGAARRARSRRSIRIRRTSITRCWSACETM